MTIKKNDFIELDFIGIVKETGEVFDTTIIEEAKKANLFQENEKERFKPIKICVGYGMVVKGFDTSLEGKETGKDYEITLNPEDAFGKRDSKLVKIMPLSAFRQRGIDPAPGMMLALDNMLVRISTVTSGRVIVDFNNPIAGKHVIYKFRVKRLIEDSKEKIAIFSRTFIGIEPKVYEENKKLIAEFPFKLPGKVDSELKKKVKETLDADIEIKSKEQEKQIEERIEPERPYSE